MPRRTQLAPLLAALLSAPALAADAPATRPAAPGPGFSLTIYSLADPATFDPHQHVEQQDANPYYAWQNKLPGYGVVRETRVIDLKEGDNTVEFVDVASGIDPTTVSFKSLTAPDTTSVLEQNYEYDLVSADKLLTKYLGKDVVVSRLTSANGPVERVTGRLLSADAANLVLRAGKQVVVIPRTPAIQEVGFPDDTNLITKPTLLWKINARQAGKHDAQVAYQTDNLTWRADYTVTVNKDDSAADVGAWVSVLNESGASYADAKLKLVAGDVQRIQPRQPVAEFGLARAADSAAAPQGFAEKSFFEYHLYTLGRPTTLKNNSTKQIELFPSRSAVPVAKTYVYYGQPEQFRYWPYSEPSVDRNLGTESNKKVDVYLKLRNDEKNGLGLPLPAGRIRVYKRDDADGSQEFIGEDVIQHTPKDEDVLMKLGSAFDVVGERKQTDFKLDARAHVLSESFEVKLRNHKDAAADVIVKENLFRWSTWEITESSDKWTKQDYRTIHIPVRVDANAEKTVTYTVRYTW